jgi:hypothetical protein
MRILKSENVSHQDVNRVAFLTIKADISFYWTRSTRKYGGDMKRQIWFWRIPFSVTLSPIIRTNSSFPLLLKRNTFNLEDGVSMFLHNYEKRLSDYMGSHPRRKLSLLLQLWEPQIQFWFHFSPLIFLFVTHFHLLCTSIFHLFFPSPFRLLFYFPASTHFPSSRALPHAIMISPRSALNRLKEKLIEVLTANFLTNCME